MVRLPFYFQGINTTLPDLNHFLIGESLANGSSLYISLWEDISPFSAWTYMLLHFLFGKSIWAYHTIGFLLMFFQCLLFNAITYKNKLYNEGTYVPAIVYGLLMSISSGMYSLSPILMSSTFILLALNNIFRQVEFRMKSDEPILGIGIYLGVAALFYLPAAIFGLIALIILAFFSSTIGRRYVLVFFGFALPLLLVICYFYFIDGVASAWSIVATKIFNPNKFDYLSYQSILLILAIPLLYFIFSIVRIVQKNRFSNYQLRLIQLVIVWMLMSLFLMIWMEKLVTSFIFFIPTFAIIITHYFLLIKNRLKAEMLFSLFMIGVLCLNLAMQYNWFSVNTYIDNSHEQLLSTPYDDKVADKRILVLGDNLHIYKNASLATPFLDWQLSSETLKEPNYYGKSARIYLGFTDQNPPEIIIDLENCMPKLQKNILFIQDNYVRTEANVYRLKQGTN